MLYRPVARAIFAPFAIFACAIATAATPIDGTWKSSHPQPETVTFRTGSGAVTLSASSGTGYTARLDGTQAKVTGEKEPLTVSVKMPTPDLLDETTYKADKAIINFKMKVAPDGKTANVTWKSLVTGKSGTYSLTRQ